MGRKIGKGLCAVILGLAFLYGYLFHDLSNIKGRELLLEEDSPNGIYRAEAYLSGGGATSGYGILVKVQSNVLGGSRNIFWKYPKSDVKLNWKDEWRLEIDGEVLDVRWESYDYRHDGV